MAYPQNKFENQDIWRLCDNLIAALGGGGGDATAVNQLAEIERLDKIKEQLTTAADNAVNSPFLNPDGTSALSAVLAELVLQNNPAVYQSLAYSLAQLQTMQYNAALRKHLQLCEINTFQAAAKADAVSDAGAFFIANPNLQMISYTEYFDGASYNITVITSSGS